MDLMLSADQEAIQTSVREFLDGELPMSRVRELAQAGPDALAPLWRSAGELGFFGLAVAEAQGGAGYAITEEMVLFEELGRVLAPGPWLGSVLAARALAAHGGKRDELARVLHGEIRAALVDGTAAASSLVARDGELTGQALYVPDSEGAAAFLVLAPEAVLWVPASAAVAVEPRPSLDPTRRIAHVRFSAARADVLAGGDASRALRRAAAVLSCAEAVGGIQRTVEMSVEYAKVRKQFDRPIGSFQAVKHRCADMAVRAEVARSSTTYAVVSVRDGAADQDFQVSVAKILCAGAYLQNAADNVQNHGGMGFTWECDAHLYVKRARSFDVAFGSRLEQLDRLAAGFRAA